MSARALTAAAFAIVLMPVAVAAQIRVESSSNKHNLSSTGPGPVKSQTVTEVCVFCHTTHNASPSVPLWNQTLSAATYQPYSSTTLKANVGVPTGSSKLCLSCHDGTIAIGSTGSLGQIAMQGVNAQGQLTGASVLGTDLRTSHPISFVPTIGAEIANPPPGSAVKLDAAGQVQCASCHEPHQMDIDTTTKKFLVTNNSSSGLCLVCHNKQYWATNPGTHGTSTKAYTSAQGAHTGYTTVATNGCESCHKPHNAAAAPRSLKGLEEITCGSGGSGCHGSSGIGRNIQAEFSKAYRHPTYDITPSVHDASESPTNGAFTLPEIAAGTPRHAECPDCHNSHASYAAAAAAPKGSGKIAGVWGIDRNNAVTMPAGSPPSVNEYEICFKCHGDSANKPQSAGAPAPPYPNRVALQFNMRLMFDAANPSFHPVEAPLPGASGFSIKPGWTVTSVIKCTECHDNDTGPNAPTPGAGPSGPHGSAIKHLLVAAYNSDTDTRTATLCYKCHDSTKIPQSGSWRNTLHQDHHGGYSCSTCHDPHGISSAQGNTVNNGHLINFDKRFVTPSSGGLLRFEQTGVNHGRCYLTCHGQNHNPETY